jgi:hypothetical protein
MTIVNAINIICCVWMIRELFRRKYVMDKLHHDWEELIRKKIEFGHQYSDFVQEKITFEKEVRAFRSKKENHEV